jgi:hypothetical protein
MSRRRSRGRRISAADSLPVGQADRISRTSAFALWAPRIGRLLWRRLDHAGRATRDNRKCWSPVQVTAVVGSRLRLDCHRDPSWRRSPPTRCPRCPASGWSAAVAIPPPQGAPAHVGPRPRSELRPGCARRAAAIGGCEGRARPRPPEAAGRGIRRRPQRPAARETPLLHCRGRAAARRPAAGIAREGRSSIRPSSSIGR